MPTHRAASPLAIWIALGTVYLVWGSTYLAIAITVQTLPALLSAGLRFFLAGLILVGWVAARTGLSALRASRAELVGSGIVGILLLVGGNGLLVLAERTVPSGIAALIVASVPLWLVVFRRLAGERIHASAAIGVAIGLGGVAFLVIPRGLSGSLDPLGIITMLVVTLSWSLGTFLSPRLRLPRSSLLSTGFQQLAGGVTLLVAGALVGEAASVDPTAFSTRSVVALVYLVTFGSLVGFTAYAWLLQHAPLTQVATYAYVNPVVAVFLGFLILAEPITPSIIIGAAIIVAAVAYIVQREGARQRAARSAPPGALAASEAD